MLGLVLLKNLLSYAYAVLNSWVRTILVHRLRARIVDQLLEARVDFTERQDAGQLVT